LYLKIFDPYAASYGVDDAEHAISQLAQTTMRSELGKIVLDSVFKERESLNVSIVESINKASKAWGIDCLRYEIKDVKLPAKVQEAMQMQVEAERKKRAAILESEGLRESNINKAEGIKQSKILVSQAQQLEQINEAQGEAEALLKVAKAKADSIRVMSEALRELVSKNLNLILPGGRNFRNFGRLGGYRFFGHFLLFIRGGVITVFFNILPFRQGFYFSATNFFSIDFFVIDRFIW
jgi:regulator of protease activity HflC (stomatin/prohibitin superfamily)